MTLGQTSTTRDDEGPAVNLGRAFREAVTGMAILDLDGRFRRVNPALCAMVGRSEAELLGLRSMDVTHPDDRILSAVTMDGLVSGRLLTDQVRKRYVRPDGSTVVVVRTTTGLRGAAGRVVALLSQMVDVTETEAAQQALRQSDMRSRALIAHAAELTVLVDRDGSIVFASPASERLLGYTPEEVVGRPALDFVHPDDLQRASAAFLERLEGQSVPLPVEYRALHRDGAWRFTEVLTTNLLDEPAVGALVLNIRDVTQAHEYRERLASSERRLRSLLGNAWDAITLHGPDGQYLFCSPAVTAQLGYSPEELIGTSPFDLMHPDDAPMMREASRASATVEGGGAVQYRVRHKDGSWRWLESTIRNSLDDPAIAGIVVSTRDVTLRRRHAAQQEAVTLLSSEGLRGGPLDGLFTRTIDVVAEVLDVGHCSILRTERAGRLRVVARHGRTLSESSYPQEIDGRPTSFPARAVLDRASVTWGLGTDSPAEEQLRQALSAHGLVSGAAVVIPGEDGPYGVLSVRSTDPEPLSSADVSFLEATANVLAAAVGRRKVEDELRSRAQHDELTGLPNRVLLLERLDGALVRLGRDGGSVAVLFIDIDDFKVVNDSLGHIAGDTVVSTVGERVAGVLRATDTVARFGGDEFVVVCEDTDEARAGRLAERIKEAVAAPIDLVGRAIVVTASIGIAINAGCALTSDDLLAQADTAMYAAKTAGKDRASVFDASMRKEVTDRLNAAAGLRQALPGNEMELYYQPVVRTDDRKIIGSEALLRWHHPVEGFLTPDRFIGHAESTGLILPIGTWVLQSACRQASRWAEQGWAGYVSINVSARQLLNDDIVAAVDAALEAASCDPSRILLEVTESAVMSDLQRAARVIGEVRRLGVSVGMDDFGTGHSSLSYLASLPFDFVKIDRSFVTGYADDRRAAALLETVATLCRTLGLPAIAEGVETEAQLEQVRSLGIPYAQGYLFGRPTSVGQTLLPATLDHSEHLAGAPRR
ncbi:EAL domain-containing protein [Acidiferrimicrobium sp. IK]|uniref:bifunctional diguanylate cyclase/phosphodiesterase n=1 Tax=Acidiferrimicrobium sp. IK TaxID=2871700 RepID=UPI0021CB4A2A|nr:bifunctional diguanylate cyclase/phosphodiesterase [Acidiferrimicrobium sp. IK]MCU4184811.1 EAL domain-containing protein [Acidiferrimicrobium sp. IK]